LMKRPSYAHCKQGITSYIKGGCKETKTSTLVISSEG
jgi:hypothetical protein